MKRLKFKNPFYGMDNALKLIPESYKVDGKEFEITDGIETYRIKWSTSLNEGTVLMSSNKNLINEDMQKIKHLMGYKSEDTLGLVKGKARIDENKVFNVVLDKTKKLLNEDYGVHDNGQLDMFADQDEVNKLDKLSIKKEKFSKGLMDEIIDYVSDGEIIFDFSKKGFTDDVNKNLDILFNDKELLGTILNNILHDINDDIELEKETGDDYSSLSRLKDEVEIYLDTLASRMNYRNLKEIDGDYDSPTTNNDAWKWEDRKRMKDRIEAKFNNHNPRLELINSEDHNRHSEFGDDNLVILTKQSSPELEYELQKLASENEWGFESFLDGLYLMYQGNGYGNDPDFMAGKSGGIRETKKILPKKINEMTGGYGFSNEGNLEGHENPIQEEDLQSGEQTNTTNQSNAKTDTNVDNLMNYIKEMPKFNTLASKIRTPDSKRNAGLAYAQLVAGGDKNILAKIGRAIMKASGESDGITNEGEIYELENPELADLNKDGEISSYEEKRGEAIEKSIEKDRFDEIFDGMYEEDNEEFIPHGHYTVSNTGGYEIMISDSGDAAKVRDAYGSDNPETSDWLEIEYVPGEDGEMEPVIDPNGYNIPLNMVMRTNR